jgi:hypothetical protein
VIIEAFPKVPRVWQEVMWFGRFQRDKQNKQPYFIDKYLLEFFKFFNGTLGMPLKFLEHFQCNTSCLLLGMM